MPTAGVSHKRLCMLSRLFPTAGVCDRDKRPLGVAESLIVVCWVAIKDITHYRCRQVTIVQVTETYAHHRCMQSASLHFPQTFTHLR